MTKRLHKLCDAYWKAKMPSRPASFYETVTILHYWRLDKLWIDQGCVLLGNINGNGKYPAPPAWWPLDA